MSDSIVDHIDRIKESIKTNNYRHEGKEVNISDYELARVFEAMADHTLIMGMIHHQPDPTSPWPEATSVGRWMHSAAYYLFDKEEEQ